MEYKAMISNSISKNKDYFFTTTAKDMKNELEEVYRKAKAFDRIAEVHSDNDLYSDEYVLETIQEQIDKLERADDER